MNIGIYLDSLEDFEQLSSIADFVNNSIKNKEIDDASIFYNTIAYVPFDIKCGTFNSTDLWNFDGQLLVSSLNCLLSVNNIVNNIDIYYYFGWEDKVDVLELVKIFDKDNIKTIATNQGSYDEYYRITGKKPVGICEKYNNILDIIKGFHNECSANCKNVYR